MSNSPPPIVEEFKFVDKAFIFSKDLSNLITNVDSSRVGRIKRKYIGVKTHAIKMDGYYIYAEAVLSFSRRTSKLNIASFRKYANDFLEDVRRNAYSQD